MLMLITASKIKKAKTITAHVFFGECCKWNNRPEMIAPASANAYTKMYTWRCYQSFINKISPYTIRMTVNEIMKMTFLPTESTIGPRIKPPRANPT